jgi:anthranilate phosphoribosyltransferase
MREGIIRTVTIKPEDFGLARCKPEDLRCGEGAEARAAVIHAILAGDPGPRRAITELNAAAALIVGGRAGDFPGGLKLAAEAIDSGAARRVLARLVEVSNQAAG